MSEIIAKRISDALIGNLNKGTKKILELFDVQNKNLFEMILYPNPPSKFGTGTLKALAGGALDNILARVHIQSIDVPFLKLEYENYQEIKEIKDLVYPEMISITFVENELGFIRTYIQSWFEEILEPDPENKNSYYFLPGQEAAKKNGVIIPLMGHGLPSFPVIKFYGLKPMSIENIVFSQGDGDPMLITVSFSIDNVWWETLF